MKRAAVVGAGLSFQVRNKEARGKARGLRTASLLLLPFCFCLPSLLAGCAQFAPKPLSPEQTAARFEARSLDDPGLRKFIEQNRAGATHESPAPPRLGGKDPSDPRKRGTPNEWDFETLTLVALYYHPSLDVARAQWAVARAGIRTAGQRPNPAASLAPQYTSNSPSGESPWVAALTFEPVIETAGKRGYRLEQAKQLSESARLKLAAQAWQVRSRLRTALLDYAAARQRVVLLENVRDAQEQILKLLEGRFQAGESAATELTTPRVALIRALADLADTQRQVIDSQAAVAQALGVPLQALAGRELQFALETSSTVLQPRDGFSEIRRQALYSRADLLAALADYAASQSALQLEIARQYPDIRLGPGYEYDQGLHKWGLSMGADFLPLLNRNQGPIAEAQAQREQAAAEFLALQAQVTGEIDHALAACTASQDQLRQIDSLLAMQRKNVQAVEAMVKAGAADQSELRTAQLEVSTTEATRLDAVVNVQQALGRLEDAMQVPVDALGLPNAEFRVRGRLPSVEQNPRSATTKENEP